MPENIHPQEASAFGPAGKGRRMPVPAGYEPGGIWMPLNGVDHCGQLWVLWSRSLRRKEDGT